MKRILKTSSWKRLRDLSPEPEPVSPPKVEPPMRLVAVTAQGTRLVAPNPR